MAPPRVLVIGAGFAGTALAVGLAARGCCEVTMVDRKRYFEVVFANARTLVEPALADRAVIGVEELKPHGAFVQGDVVELRPRAAQLADGRELPFDFAAVCTGSGQAFGKGAAATAGERRAELKAQHEALLAAPAVVVVGGGSLGVELAAEVATDVPGKPVHLVHSGERLMPTLPPRAHSLALAWLQRHGVQVLLGDRLAAAPDDPKQPLSTASGAQLPAGALVLWATGTRPNTGFAAKGLGAGVLDEASGLIKVGAALQVEGHPHIFALGDACNVAEEKLAYLAKMHAPLVAGNIAALAAAGAAAAAAAAPGAGAGAPAEAAAPPPAACQAAGAGGGGGARSRGCGSAARGGAGAAPALAAWRPGAGRPKVMIVSLGRRSGIMHVGGVTFGGWLVSKVKSIDVFVGMSRREVCAQP